MTGANTRLKYRTVWVSDVHLGSKASRAEYLIDFLKSTECEKLYLVGDIIDRGPKIRETVELVRAMTEKGHAQWRR